MKDTLQRILKETFKENKNLAEEIECKNNYFAFKTSDNEIAIFDIITDNVFDAKKLASIVNVAETYCKEYETRTNIFLLTSGDVEVTVSEQSIPSHFDFTIKLAMMPFMPSPHEFVLMMIKAKINEGIPLDEDDIGALKALPMVCPEEMRWYYLNEVLTIITQLGL